MEQKEFDDKIIQALHQGTDSAVSLHDETLKRIIDNIQKIENGDRKISVEKRIKSTTKRLIAIATIAALFMIIFMGSTGPGQAALVRIRQWFEPEKILVEEIEGMPEDIDGKLQESEMGYVLYYDQERYRVETIEGVDRIVPIMQAENYPDVFMEIRQIKDQSPKVLATEWESNMREVYTTVENKGLITSPIPSLLVYANQGTKWDDVVVRVYFIDNTQGGTFVVTQQFFIEAEEGHGVRLDNILKEFVVIAVEEENE